MYRTQASIDSASTHAIANDIHSPGPASRAIVGKSEGIGGIVGLGFRPIAAPPWLAETGLEDAEVAGRLNRLMTSLAQHDQFSGVVQVQRSDRTTYAAAFGEADKAGRIANTLETRFTSRSRMVRGKK